MGRKLIWIVAVCALACMLGACAGPAPSSSNASSAGTSNAASAAAASGTSSAASSAASTATASSASSASSASATSSAPAPNASSAQASPTTAKVLVLTAGQTQLHVELADNSATQALLAKLEEGPVSVSLHDYGNFEKVGALGFELPTSDQQINTEAGDIVLYQGNQISIFYDTNSYSYTRLGRIEGFTGPELLDALGGPGEVSIQLSLAQPTPLPDKFAIIHTNDMHGYFTPSDRSLGLGAVAQMKADYRAQGYDVLLLDAGDVMQGTALVSVNQGADVPQFLNAAGYDALCIGNHDFDYGSDVLEQRMAEFAFPTLSANIYVDATGQRFAQPNTIFELSNGAKVGVFALTTPETKTSSRPANTAGLTILANQELYACAQEQIDELRAQGCSLVLCLGHLGEEEALAPNCASDVVANTRGLDLFIDAHDHQVEDAMVENADGVQVPVIETGSYLGNVGVLTWEGGTFAHQLVAVGEYEGQDENVAAMVAAAQERVDQELAQVSGTTDFELFGGRRPGVRDSETNLANFCTDAILWIARNNATSYPDAAIINGGGIRTSIDAGEITHQELLNVMPFSNDVCTVKVTGAQLLEALEASTQDLPAEIGGFPQVADLVYTVDTTVAYEKGELYPNTTYYAPAAPGARVSIQSVGGKKFDPNATYTIATLNFIAQGGDTYYAFAQAAQTGYEGLGYTDFDALQNYLANELGGHVPASYAQPQGRTTVIVEEGAQLAAAA